MTFNQCSFYRTVFTYFWHIFLGEQEQQRPKAQKMRHEKGTWTFAGQRMTHYVVEVHKYHVQLIIFAHSALSAHVECVSALPTDHKN